MRSDRVPISLDEVKKNALALLNAQYVTLKQGTQFRRQSTATVHHSLSHHTLVPQRTLRLLNQNLQEAAQLVTARGVLYKSKTCNARGANSKRGPRELTQRVFPHIRLHIPRSR
jgi:hypothetical protein